MAMRFNDRAFARYICVKIKTLTLSASALSDSGGIRTFIVRTGILNSIH